MDLQTRHLVALGLSIAALLALISMLPGCAAKAAPPPSPVPTAVPTDNTVAIVTYLNHAGTSLAQAMNLETSASAYTAELTAYNAVCAAVKKHVVENECPPPPPMAAR